jgi:hypothetical protein
MAFTYINNLFDFTPFDGKNLPIVSLFLIEIKMGSIGQTEAHGSAGRFFT